MKQKLLIALLTAAAITGLLAGNVVAYATADETRGTGGVRMEEEDLEVLFSGTVGEDNIPWQLTADGTLTVGRIGDAVGGEGSYSIPDWNDPFTYDMSVENWLDDAIANGEVNPWIKHQGLIKALVIGDDIGYIGNRSFQVLYLIEGDVIIPDSVKTIGEGAFQYNNFASITIGKGVESIEAYAFDNSWKLTEIHIPASVSYISDEAFKWCNNVKAFTVDENNQNHTAVDGVLFTKDMTALIRYPWAKTDTTYNVPNGVTELQATCFEASRNLTEITLPESLETIGWWALSNLNVTELVIPASVNSVQDSAFRNNNNLTDIYFQGNKPDDWQGELFTLHNDEEDYDYFNENIRIHYNAAAENWGDIVDEYGDNIVIDGGYRVEFVDDDGYTELCAAQILAIDNPITVPAAPAKDYGSFARWCAWESDYTTDNDTTITLTQDLLNDAGYDTNWDGFNDTITFEAEYDMSHAPDFRAEGWIDTDEDGTDDIHWFVEWNRNLTVESTDDNKVSIPDYSNENPAPWHDYASYIRSVNIWNNIDRIGSYAFADLFVLDGVDIPGDVKSIGTCAFYNCTNISWININDGVERIEHDVFCGVNIGDLWLPSSVTTMDDDAFASFRTSSYNVDGNNPNYWSDEQGILYKRNGDGTSTLLAYPKNSDLFSVVIPEGVTAIYKEAFSSAWNIGGGIHLPKSLQTIGDMAFFNCHILTIDIPANVTSIGYAAFACCDFDRAYFYGNAPELGKSAFAECGEGFKIYYIDGKTGFDTIIEYETDTFDPHENYVEGEFSGNWNDEDYHITWEITKDGWLNVYGEGNIPDNMAPWWRYLAYVRKVNIDDRITYIGNNTFFGLTYVDQIHLPANVREIGYSAFNCDGSSGNNIGALVLPTKLEIIHDHAFGNLGITEVTIPASLRHIDSGWVFYDNPITTYAVESGSTNFAVDNYGALYALDENGSKAALVSYPRDAAFTSYTVPEGVKELYGASIRNACNLTEVNLPDTLEVIGNEALAHYYSDLSTLTIPDSVREIYSNAFRWGNKTSIVFLGDKPDFINDGEGEGNQFWDNKEEFTIYYYEGANGWDTYYPENITTYMLREGEEPFVARGDFWDGWDIHWTLDKNGVLDITGTGEIPGNWGGYDWREYMDQVKEIVIEDGITGIGDYMFYGISGVTNLRLPSTLTYIGNYAFASGYDDNAIGELVLPEGLRTIGDFAFHMTGLTKVTIPSTVENIESHAFVRNQIQDFVVNEGNDCYSVDEYGVLFEKREHEDEDGNGRGEYFLRLHSYPAGSSMTSYTIPEKLNEIEVGEIGDWAFTNAQNLTRVNLSNVWGICAGGFLNCDNITSLNLTNMHWLSSEAIFGCDKLTSITLDKRIPEVFTWEDGYNMPFVNNGANNENDGLVVYYYSDAENLERLDVLRENYKLEELTRSDKKGDITGDGTVDNDDLQILLDYFAGKNVRYFDRTNADIDGDGQFTRRDVMILNRYLAGWTGYDEYFEN